jgi:hypothetical protein
MEIQYVVIIQVCSPCGSRPSVRYQLTYEVTRLRPGLNRWFLVRKEELPQAA